LERGSSILVSHLEVQEVSTSARLLAYIATTFKGLAKLVTIIITRGLRGNHLEGSLSPDMCQLTGLWYL
jgi:hypothetical protein